MDIKEFIAVTKGLPEIEAELWQVRSSDRGTWIQTGLISKPDYEKLGELYNIQLFIEAQVERAGGAIPKPDLKTNPEYPKEYIQAQIRLTEINEPYQDLTRIREALYHAGPSAYSIPIYQDPELASLAKSLGEWLKYYQLPYSEERAELTAFIDRRDRLETSKVRTIRGRLWREYEAQVNQAKDKRRKELEIQYSFELSGIKRIEDQVELARRSKIQALSIRVKAILEIAAGMIDEDRGSEPVLEDPNYQQMIRNNIQAAKARREMIINTSEVK